ncbi:MAG: DUF3256 family protein, partial [Paludibacteraceae bacterium]|nr:DUF3256 family protein [Paludibacteraceae bacterium]
MKKTICFSFLILLAGFNLQAQNVISYFTDMPGYLLPSLESSHKLELIENYQKTGKDTLENLFGGKVRMLELDTVSQHISISTTSVSRFEMKILERSDKTKFIAIINTVCGPVCSSYIHFFDTEWKEIRMEFPKFDNRQWLKSTDETIDGVKLQDMIKGIFLEFNFNPHEKSVEVRNN